MGLIEISDIKDLRTETNIIVSKKIEQSQGKEDIVATLDKDAIRLYSKVNDYDNRGGNLCLSSVRKVSENFEYYFNNCKTSGHKFYIKNNS